MKVIFREYCGPEGFGAAPEFSGDSSIGENRMQSMEPFEKRLTAEVKNEITNIFAARGLEVKKIDKVYRGHAFLRVAYNGSAWK
mgnify:CR=1 FL=1